MTVISPGLFNVLKRFPDRKETIKRLFTESENFRSACEDYQRCAQSLQYWKQSASKEATARQEEYAALLRDLEEEILENLKGGIENEEEHDP